MANESVALLVHSRSKFIVQNNGNRDAFLNVHKIYKCMREDIGMMEYGGSIYSICRYDARENKMSDYKFAHTVTLKGT